MSENVGDERVKPNVYGMPKTPVRFAGDLEAMLVSIDDVAQHPDNPNSGDVDIIAESILAHGFLNPIIAQRSTGYILAGNHRYAALLALGESRIPVVWHDGDDEQARRILIMDNRSSEVAVRDQHALEELLKSLEESEIGLAGTGYDEDSLHELILANLRADHAGFGTGGDKDVDEALIQPMVLINGFMDNGNLKEFTEDDVEEQVAVLRAQGYNAYGRTDG